MNLVQKGLGVLGGVVLIATTALIAAMQGLPGEPVALLFTVLPVALGLTAVGIGAVPVSQKFRSAGFGLVAVMALLGLVAGLTVGFGTILAVGQFAGGAFLLVAAAFPMLLRG